MDLKTYPFTQDSRPNLSTQWSNVLVFLESFRCTLGMEEPWHASRIGSSSEEVTTLGTHHKFMTKVADNIRIFQPATSNTEDQEG